MRGDMSEKFCFVISPIGTEGSSERLRSDQVLKHIISPAAIECGYRPVRADQISEPGLITSQVIQHIADDPLVIADLTGRNPNVFYELALRHALKKPCVQIIHATESIPFDVASSRTIHVDHHDLDSAARAKSEIINQIKAVEKNPSDVDTPISVAVELQSLRRSDNPLEKSNAEIITMLNDIRNDLTDLRDIQRKDRQAIRPAPALGSKEIPGELITAMLRAIATYHDALAISDEKAPTLRQWQQIRHSAEIGSRALDGIAEVLGLPSQLVRDAFRSRPKENKIL